MVLELGDHSKVENKANDLVCDIEFKTKVRGCMRKTTPAYLSDVAAGLLHWHIQRRRWEADAQRQDCRRGVGQVVRRDGLQALGERRDRGLVQCQGIERGGEKGAAESEQDEFESRRLWSKVTEGIKEKNLEKATENKSAIEEAQRKANREREEKGETWRPKLFTPRGDQFVPKME
ncbi:hypothetical protein L7F22_025654 [Adiantum nelumboides]|nr:hypothetical protein [Adiantum nelumboides]